jgi:hypothetical protein
VRWMSAILVVALGSAAAGAAVLDVFPDGSGPYVNLQQALWAAQPGDTLALAAGTFTGPGNRNLILDGMDITIRSADGDPASCVLDLEGDGRGFLVYLIASTAIRIEGLTLRAGDPRELPEQQLGGYGGGLAARQFAAGGMLTIERCIFEDNVAEAGGAAFLYQTAAHLIDCVFRNNIATDGAGVYCGQCSYGGGVRFTGCLFHGNDYPYPDVGGYGAGAYYSHSLGTVASCTFTQNRAWLGGGLLVSTASTVSVDRCLIAFAAEGEGLAVFNGACDVALSDIFGNEGGDWIGAIAGELGIDCNMRADPLFCDAASGDFSLRDDSPCLPENNDCGLMGAFGEGCSSMSGPPPVARALAGPLGLSVACPSTGRDALEISFVLHRAGPVQLRVFDLHGRCVASLIDGVLSAGPHRLAPWRSLDAQRDLRGGPLASGVYLLRLAAEGETQSGRLLILR